VTLLALHAMVGQAGFREYHGGKIARPAYETRAEKAAGEEAQVRR
jgi:hypothetical protein